LQWDIRDDFDLEEHILYKNGELKLDDEEDDDSDD
jgi:hypothetical protein